MTNPQDFEKRLVAYIAASGAARVILAELNDLELTALDVQNALAEVLNVTGNPPRKLVENELTTAEIVELLRDFDFHKIHPKFLAEVVLDEPVLPNLPLLLTEKTVKLSGEVWRIHKNDVDPFPSVPHAHNYAAGVVLHLGTGEIFDTRNRKLLGKIGCKNLLRLRGELERFSLPSTECC
jgi:hypothetical protein